MIAICVPWVVSICLLIPVPTQCIGDDASTAKTTLKAIDSDGNPVELPSPPGDIAKLIEDGDVRFVFYDPQKEKRKFAGETRFEFHYTYQTRSDWKIVSQNGLPALRISVEYRNVKLTRDHQVLLPMELIGEDLFERPLTRHEFDHVEISSDARLEGLLTAMLKDRNASIIEPLISEEGDARDKPRPSELARISRRMVKEASDRVFNDFVEIVFIRYRELDRVSQNGLVPLSNEERLRIIQSEAQADAPDSEKQ